MEWPPRSLEMVIYWLLYTGAFGLLGLGLVVLGFKIFDWLTPRLDIQRELGEKHNIAVAIRPETLVRPFAGRKHAGGQR